MSRLLNIILFLLIVTGLILFSSCANSDKSENYHYQEEDFDTEDNQKEFDEEEFEIDVKSNNKNYNTFSKSIERKKTDFLKTRIEFGSGEFFLSSTSKNTANVHFYYEKEHWSPFIDFYYEKDTSKLEIKLKRDHEFDGNHHNKCKVLLNDDTPLELDVAFGAGEGNLKLSELNLKSINIALGAGDFKVDLSNSSPENIDVAAGVGEGYFDLTGKWKNDCRADFACGIGDLTIIVPKNIGVKIEVAGLFGDVDAEGLKKVERKTWVNKAFGNSDYTLDIDIAGALGNIDLILEE